MASALRKPYRYYAYPDDAAMLALMEEHGNYVAISRELGMTAAGLVRNVKGRGLKAAMDARRRHPDLITVPPPRTLEALFREHVSFSAVAQELGVSRGTVERWVAADNEMATTVAQIQSDAQRVIPSDNDLCEAMERLRSLRHVALEFGIPERSFWTHLYRRPELKVRLDGFGGRRKNVTPEQRRARRREWDREYRRKNPWLARARYLSRRERLLRADPCAYCGGPGGTVDHIVPVMSGGGSEWENLTSACWPCNRAKSSKPLLIFMLDRVLSRSQD